jgi:hypothetical protein
MITPGRIGMAGTINLNPKFMGMAVQPHPQYAQAIEHSIHAKCKW